MDNIHRKYVNVFDFDRTIIKIDGLRIILILLALRYPVRSILLIYRYFLNLKKSGKIRLSEYFIPRVLKNKKANDLDNLLAIYKIICKHFMNKEVLKVLEELKKRQSEVIIATASPTIAVEKVIKGVQIIGFELEIKNSKFTKKTINLQPYGFQKYKYVEEYCNKNNLEIGIAFSDSESDYYLLNNAQKAFLISKEGKITLWEKREKE